MIKRAERVMTLFQGKYYVFKVLLEYSNPKNNSKFHSLTQTVLLDGCENPSESEEKITKEKTPVHHFEREWDNGVEKSSYVNLRNIQLLDSLRKHPALYLNHKIPIPYEERLT